MTSSIFELENGIQPYAWGSPTALAEFLERPNPEGRPQAELWIGAHPVLPSRALTPDGLVPLGELIRRAPETALGREVAARHGGELPFLFKVLAVAAPLSIQCHPNRAQAREGFERENRLGIPLDAPHRNYRDANHKPELVAALTRFTALKGFRPIDEALGRLREISTPALAPAVDALRRSEDGGLRRFFSALVSLTPEASAGVAAAAVRVARERRVSDPAWEWVARLAERYPTDAGILSPLYLNLVVLEPEQGLYLPAGELHAYLDGLGVEIMANSDNVLRGGLTPKHVDVAELMRVVVFRSDRPSVLRPRVRADGERVYETAAAEFELALLDLTGLSREVGAAHGVEILLVLDGRVQVTCAGTTLDLARGAAAFIPAGAGAYRLEGQGTIARARVPRPQ